MSNEEYANIIIDKINQKKRCLEKQFQNKVDNGFVLYLKYSILGMIDILKTIAPEYVEEYATKLYTLHNQTIVFETPKYKKANSADTESANATK